MTELRKRGGGGDPDSTDNASDKVNISRLLNDNHFNLILSHVFVREMHTAAPTQLTS